MSALLLKNSWDLIMMVSIKLMMSNLFGVVMKYFSHTLFPSVNGNWGSWGSYGTCSRSCGSGLQTRYRACSNPAPAHGGKTCAGFNKMVKVCNTHKCPGESRFANNICIYFQQLIWFMIKITVMTWVWMIAIDFYNINYNEHPASLKTFYFNLIRLDNKGWHKYVQMGKGRTQ